MEKQVKKSEEEWKKELNDEQFHVCRQKGTERPFTGKYYNSKEKGTFVCVCCAAVLFDSNAKFDSGTGWPSFWTPADKKNVESKEDLSHGMRRVEVLCQSCGAHLGHVFDDGPQPTGLRYCINSAALKLIPKTS